MGKRVAIVGTRFKDVQREKWVQRIQELISSLPADTEVITAGAPGTDRTAAELARARGLKVTVLFPNADYSNDPRFFLHHNHNIVSSADEVHAFWDGVSAGTHHAIQRARFLRVPVFVHHMTDKDWEVHN